MSFPNQLTVLRIILTPVALVLLLMNDVISIQVATGVFVVASLTDWYDGHFARKYGYVTNWGKSLDPIADKILITAMLIGFAILKYVKFGLVIIIVVRDIIITALRGYMMVYGKPVTTKMVAKWKTFTQVGLVYALFIYINLDLPYSRESVSGSEVVFPGFKLFIDNYMLFVTAFTVITGVIYLADNWRPVKILFWRAYRAVISFRMISALRKSATASLNSELNGNVIGPNDSSKSPVVLDENKMEKSTKNIGKSINGDQQNSEKSAAP